MKKFKVSTLLLAIVSTAVLTASCAKTDPGAASSTPAASTTKAGDSSAAPVSKVTLHFVSSDEQGSVMYNTLSDMIKDFNSKHNNIEVAYDNIPYDSFIDKLTAQVIGDRTPDAGLLLDRWATAMVAQNALLPLKSYLPSDYSKDFVQNSWDYAVVNGEPYAIPLFANVQALLYNKDLLDKAGVQVPTKPENAWSFDELVKAAQTVKEKTGIPYGFAHWPASTPSRLSQYLVASGGSILSPDFKTVTLDNPKGIELLKKIQDTFKSGLVPKDNWTAKGTPEPNFMHFVNQEIAFFVASGNFQTVTLDQNIKDKFKWGFTFMPNTLGTPIELAGFKNTKHPKEVVEFLTFMANPDNMAKLAITANTVPTRTNLSGDTLTYKIAPDQMKLLMQQLKLASPQIQGEMKQPYWSEIDLMLRKKLELLSLNQLTPEEAAKQGAEEAKKIIAKYQ